MAVDVSASWDGARLRLQMAEYRNQEPGGAHAKPKRRTVWVKLDRPPSATELARFIPKMVEYVCGKAPATARGPRSTEWYEDSSVVHLVPPSGGEGGEKDPAPESDRSADDSGVPAALPSSLPPSGAGGGGERSDLLSVVDLRPDVLPGQLELPLMDGA